MIRGGALSLEMPDLSPAMRDLLNSDAARQLMRLAADKTATNEQCRRAADNFADEIKRRRNYECLRFDADPLEYGG